jgi:N-methylhydantoinase A
VTAYVTTKGFRDIPFIQRGNRKHHYDMSWVKPKPLCLKRHCFEVDERIDAKGRVVQAARRRRCAVAEAIREPSPRSRRWPSACSSPTSSRPTSSGSRRSSRGEELPGHAISISFEVLPKWKEYERASTTLADAYLKPVVGRRLNAMRAKSGRGGDRRPAVLIRSNGGEMTLDAAAATPVQL